MADWAEERAGELAARLVPRDKYYWDVVAAFARELRAAHAAGRAEAKAEAVRVARAARDVPLTIVGTPEDVAQAEMMADFAELVADGIAESIEALK